MSVLLEQVRLYDLFNTQTEEVEAIAQRITVTEAERRNTLLRSQGEPQRWVPYVGEQSEGEEWD